MRKTQEDVFNAFIEMNTVFAKENPDCSVVAAIEYKNNMRNFGAGDCFKRASLSIAVLGGVLTSFYNNTEELQGVEQND